MTSPSTSFPHTLITSRDSHTLNSTLLRLIEHLRTSSSVPGVPSELLAALRFVALTGDRNVRVQAFRAVRYLLVASPASLASFYELNLDIFTARALERDPKYVWERMQALKLVRTLMSLSPASVPRTLVMSLVAVAEAKDDFRALSLDTLKDLVLLNPKAVAECNGIRTLIQLLLDENLQDFSDRLTLTLIFLLDQTATRRHIHPDAEIQSLFSVFTDTVTPNGKEKEVRRAAAHKALVTIMRSWTGILCLTSNPAGLASLVKLLTLPPSVANGAWAKEAVFDLLFEILHVVKSRDLRLMTAKNAWAAMGPNLLHSYIVMVLFSFMNCGLMEVLSDLAMSNDGEFDRVAMNLLTEILRLSADLFPPSLCRRVNALPDVVHAAVAHERSADPERRFRAADIVNDLRNLSLTLDDPLYHHGESATSSIQKVESASARKPSYARVSSVSVASTSPTTPGSLDPESLLQQADPADPPAAPHHTTGLISDSTNIGFSPLQQEIRLRLQHSRRVRMAHGLPVERLAFGIDPMGTRWYYGHRRPPIAPVDHHHSAQKSTVQSHPPLEPLHARSTASMLALSSISEPPSSSTPVFPSGGAFSSSSASQASALEDAALSACEYPFAIDDTPGAKVRALRMAMDSEPLDDRELAIEFARTSVLETKKYREWRFDAVLELLEGRLYCSPKALAASLSTKLIKRQLSFLKPSKQFFAALPWTEANLQYAKVACQLFRVLLRHQCGIQYPFFQELVTELVDALIEAAQTKTPLPYDATFSRHSVAATLSREYFTLIGLLSASPDGLLMLSDKHDFFKVLGNLARDPAKDYLTRSLLSAFEYGQSAFASSSAAACDLLEGWMQMGTVHIRRAGLSHLRCLLRRKCRRELDRDWLLRMLTQELKRANVGVALDALNVLEEACQDRATLLRLVKMRPSFETVGVCANNLRLRFLSVPLGVQYLSTTGWLDAQLDAWKNKGGNDRYVSALETALVAALNTPHSSGAPGEADDEFASTDGKDGAEYPIPDGRDWTVSPAAAESGFIGGFGGFGGFRHVHSAVRSRSDDYYLDRLHQLPWRAEVKVGTTMAADAYVHTMPVRDDCVSHATFVVAPLLEVLRVGRNQTIHARLLLGSSSSADRTAASCTPEAREAVLMNAARQGKRKALVSIGRVHFEFKVKAAADESADPQISLVCVWYQLPTPDTSMPCLALSTHLYGELARTQPGIEQLRASGHIESFKNTIASLASPSPPSPGDNAPTPLQQRSALWALGHIGSCERGFELLESHGLVDFISQQATSCATLSMRGTCFYVLGLMSRTMHARERLAELGWDCAPHLNAGVIIPRDFSRMVEVPDVEYEGSWALSEENTYGVGYVPVKGKTSTSVGDGDDDDEPGQVHVILGHISNLGNAVSQKGSLQVLRKMRQSQREWFTSTLVYREALRLMTGYHFRLAARRFMHFELFNRVVFGTHQLTVFDKPLAEPDVQSLDEFVPEKRPRRRG